MQGDLSIRWWTRHPSNTAILPFDFKASELNGSLSEGFLCNLIKWQIVVAFMPN